MRNPEDVTLDELELPVRAHGCLRRLGCNTAADVAAKTPEELLAEHNFGQKSLAEVRDALGYFGLTLSGQRPRTREQQMASALAMLRDAEFRVSQLKALVRRIAAGMASETAEAARGNKG